MGRVLQAAPRRLGLVAAAACIWALVPVQMAAAGEEVAGGCGSLAPVGTGCSASFEARPGDRLEFNVLGFVGELTVVVTDSAGRSHTTTCAVLGVGDPADCEQAGDELLPGPARLRAVARAHPLARQSAPVGPWGVQVVRG